jgi:carbon monoxide dehydrogenase subunit G
MLRKAFLGVGLCCAATTSAFADFSYEQTTKITGGMMASMMKVAAAFSKAAREPIVSTVAVKGDRMAHINKNRISVIDLKSQTITDVDLQKKTYAVITFEDMTKAMQRMSEKMAEKGNHENVDDLKVKASVKETGEKKMVSGFNAKEVILSIEMEGADKKSGNKGALTMTSDMWLVPNIAGYEEVRAFYKRMGEKLAWTPGGFGMAAQRGDMMKGMGEMAKEMSKLDGVPVLQIMKMGAVGDGMTGSPNGANQRATHQPAKEATPPPTAGETAGKVLASRLPGFGGLGGFGRKKKSAEEQPQQQAAQQQAEQPAPAANNQSADASGALMESTTELTSFSSASLNASQFEVPAGFKEVEHEMKKALR